MLHDEVIWDVPTNLTNARPAYRCENKSCPERPPVYADKAPKCYTCDRPMSVAADAGDLLLSKAGDLEKQLEQLNREISKKVMEALCGKVPAKAETDLNGWFVPPDLGSSMWGPSPLGFGAPPEQQLAELRRMTPQAWGRYVRGENPPPQIPRKPKDEEEKYRVGDAIRHQILIGTGETLDKIGRMVLGLFRRPAEPGTELHRETDESFRGRMLAAMEPRQLPATDVEADAALVQAGVLAPEEVRSRRADPGDLVWKAVGDKRTRHTVKSLDKLDKIEIDKRIRSMARGTKADVMHAFGMIEGVKDVRLNTPAPGFVEVVLEIAPGVSVREIENEARAVCYKDLPVGIEYRVQILYNIP